jgi:ketosteroid isomerase-like protein
MFRYLAAGAACFVLAACATAPASLSAGQRTAEVATIAALLEAQDAAWNEGDIEGFMNGYWPSPELRFASGGDVVRGFDETLARYKVRYPGKDGMGLLETGSYEIDILSPDAAIAHGNWRVTRDGETLSGLYTLVLRKMDGNWFIVSDTTTSAD